MELFKKLNVSNLLKINMMQPFVAVEELLIRMTRVNEILKLGHGRRNAVGIGDSTLFLFQPIVMELFPLEMA